MESKIDWEVVNILKKVGMILEGHFIGKKSGKHFHTFLNKDALLAHPNVLNNICETLAEKIHSQFSNIDTVVGPVSGGAIIASWMAFYLSKLKDKEIKAVCLDKNGYGDFRLRSEYNGFVKRKNILLVDDIIRTGSTLMRAAVSIKRAGGFVVVAGAILNRNPSEVTEKKFGIPLVVVTDFPEVGYMENEMPEWLKRMPINKNLEKTNLAKKMIGVIGRIGSGKSTFIREFIKRCPDTRRVATGDILKETLSLWGLPADRKRLILLSKLLREHFGSNVIVDTVRRRIKESLSRYILIDGVRGPKVYSLLKEFDGSLLVSIIAETKTRYRRITSRLEKPDESNMSFEDFLAWDDREFQKDLDDLEQKADVRIENNGHRANFLTQIDNFIKKLG